jgi:hypothetical protein
MRKLIKDPVIPLLILNIVLGIGLAVALSRTGKLVRQLEFWKTFSMDMMEQVRMQEMELELCEKLFLIPSEPQTTKPPSSSY